jgi:hypothetical protein
MRQRSNIFNRRYTQARLLQRGNRRFTSRAWTFNSHLNLANAVTHRGACGTLGRLSGGKRCTLTCAFEADAAGGTGANSAAFNVRYCYQRIIKTRLYVNNRLRYVLPDFTFCHICHYLKNSANQIMKIKNYPRISFTPFFPATVFLGPLRVLALVRVRWP